MPFMLLDLPVSADPKIQDALDSRAGNPWMSAYAIRSFDARDATVCRDLYTQGLLGGQLASNDSGLDIDDIPTAYGLSPLNHFWVAEVTEQGAEQAGAAPGTVVGMIGVQHHDEGVGEIRRLRVHTQHRRRRVGSRLLDTAVRFCRDNDCLKVALDTFIEREAAIAMFEANGFRHGRTRQVLGKDMLYFYVDLYSQK